MKNNHRIYRISIYLKIFVAIQFNLVFVSCEDFIAVEPPNNQLTGSIVFEDPTTVRAALSSVYSDLRDNSLLTGGTSGLSYIMGHYADELTFHNSYQIETKSFYENGVLPTNSIISSWWNSAFSLIYSANSVIEGVSNSKTLTSTEKKEFLGEAYFIRAYIHFQLVNLYGKIPYIDTTDYTKNKGVSKLSEPEVYTKIIADLNLSKSLLKETNTTLNTIPNKWICTAFLARVHLYAKNWDLALKEATAVLSANTYALNTDISNVFLKNSPETLWQLDTGNNGSNTVEALTYIFVSGPPPHTSLTNDFIASFEDGDSRFEHWIGKVSDGTNEWYYPYKYKINSASGETKECSIFIRLPELYFIAAEANIHLNHLVNAQHQLNIIRKRANLPSLDSTDPTFLLEALYKEKRIEFFTEQAHRWFDLKRTNRALEKLNSLKPNYKETEQILPLPASELLLNTNLLPQNEGY